jgi:hypothetical protein
MQEIRNVDLKSFKKDGDIVKKLQESIKKKDKEGSFFYNEKQISFNDIKNAIRQ